jgi:hypothetical protein
MDWPVSGAATVADRSLGNLVIGGDSYYVESLVATNIYWTPLPAFYTTAIGAGAIANGGMIVLYGGSDGIVSQNTTYGYSPSGDGTQILAPMSVARADFGYAPDANGLGYAIGGVDDSGNALSSGERYDPDANTWAAIASLPQARFHFPAVFGGGNYERVAILDQRQHVEQPGFDADCHGGQRGGPRAGRQDLCRRRQFQRHANDHRPGLRSCIEYVVCFDTTAGTADFGVDGCG